MKKMEANSCPLATVGTELLYEEFPIDSDEPEKRMGVVVDSRFDHFTQGTCEAFKCLELVFFDNGDAINPGNALSVGCKKCPVLKTNPNSRDESISYEESAAKIVVWDKACFKKYVDQESHKWRAIVWRYEHESSGNESWDPELRAKRNDAAGRNNAYHVAKSNMQLMDYDDLVESIRQYREFRKEEGPFGDGIRSTCDSLLAMLETMKPESS